MFDFSIFDLFINSAEEGVRKPDPKIFLLACERLNVKPEEVIFTDDNIENINGAKEMGIQAFLYEGFDKFLDKLKELGVDLK